MYNRHQCIITVYASQSWFPIMLQILRTFYGFWNLEFFHSTIPSFCVSENITTLRALALQYLPGLYPLLLIIITYILIKLHDRNVRVVVWMWRCFHRCLALFRRSLIWNPKASIVSTFATFLTLTFQKLFIVSVKLLTKVTVTDIQSNSSQYLLFAPTVPYFGKEHLPFAILAIAILSTFIALPPLLLLIYPTKTFQKLLGCLKIRWPALHIFADVFQGCYKNRTDGKYDYRWFAAFYFIIHFIILLAYVINYNEEFSWTIYAIIFVIGSLLFALFRPYKKNWLNILDSVILALLGIALLWIIYCIETQGRWIQLAGFIAALPLMYFVVFVTYKLLLWLRILQKYQQKSKDICQLLQQMWQGQKHRQQELGDEEQLPDRLINSCEYQPLLQNRDS